MPKNIENLLERIRNRDLNATIELMEIKDPKIIPQLLEALQDENEYVHSYASIALSCYCLPEVKEELLLLLKSPFPITRAKVIDTKILLKAKETLPAIVALESDPNKIVQISVQKAKKVFSD